MNARERLAAVADWLGWNDEDLCAGLRNAFDGLRLYDYAMAHDELPEMADEWEPKDRIAAVGYDPLANEYCEAETTGAHEASEAMLNAQRLLDSVAFVSVEGDTTRALEGLARAVGRIK